MKYPNTYERFYAWLMKALFWITYSPQDEREERFFQNAYKRAYITAVGTLLSFTVLFEVLTFSFQEMVVLIDALLVISYLAGGTAFIGKEISLKKHSPFAYWIPLILLIASAAVYGIQFVLSQI